MKKVIKKESSSTKEKKGAITKSKEKKSIYLIITVSIIIFLVLIFIIFNFMKNSLNNQIVLTVNNNNYTKSDFMMYLYSAKREYYGNDLNNTSYDMNIIIDDDNNVTLGNYLIKKTVNEIKTAEAINDIAYKNNISLNKKDISNLKKQKEKYIKSLGGRKKFKKFLKDSNSTEKSYDKMSKTYMLYDKIQKKLYSKGKIKDLNNDELEKAKKDYKNTYFKVEQIILTLIDVNTKKSLSEKKINQKKNLSNKIIDLLNNNTDFEWLVSKYSEAYDSKQKTFYEYYKKGKLLPELENAIMILDNNEITNVIQTDYAFHIIKRLELDDEMYEKYLDELREEKALKDIKKTLDSLELIYHKAFKKIKL